MTQQKHNDTFPTIRTDAVTKQHRWISGAGTCRFRKRAGDATVGNPCFAFPVDCGAPFNQEVGLGGLCRSGGKDGDGDGDGESSNRSAWENLCIVEMAKEKIDDDEENGRRCVLGES